MNRIEIKGFKSIKELDLPLTRLNIFIGSNGSGKSNFLSFFSFLENIYNKHLQAYTALNGGIEKFLHKGSKITKNIECYLRFNKNGYSFTLGNNQGQFLFEKEDLWYDSNPYYKNPINISNYNSETNLYEEIAPRAEFIKNYLSEVKKYHFHDTGKDSPFHRESNINKDIYSLYSDGSNLAALLYRIRKERPIVYNRIVKTIESIAPYFLDFQLIPNEDSGNIRLLWKNKYCEQLYSSYDLSDGTIRFIALATLLLQPQLPKTLVIDEPELGLHPFAIAKLAGLVRSASCKDCQVIMATQSVELINYFQAEEIITVDNIDGESRFERLKEEELAIWLDEYAIGDMWKQNIINTGQPS
jgi:conserved domain protein